MKPSIPSSRTPPMAEPDPTPAFTLSVQDLLWALPQDREPLPSPFSSAHRLSLGQEAHQRSDRNLCWNPGTEPKPAKVEREFALSTPLPPSKDAPEGKLLLRGRIDRLARWDADRLRVCEIKSVFLPDSRFHNISADRYPAYVRQVQIYAWMTQQAVPTASIDARLVLINLATQRIRHFDIPLDWEELEGFILLHAHYLHRLHLQRLQRTEAKRTMVDRLERWPFDGFRTGQQEFLEAADRALTSDLPLMVEAPTGMGKTVCALQCSLKFAAQTGKRVMFLTAKGTQQAHVLETIRRISAHGFPHHALQLQNKMASCINDVFLCQPSACAFLDHYGDRWAQTWCSPTPPRLPLEMSPTVVRHLSTEMMVCPFEAARQLISACDVLVADYNYLFDPEIRLRDFESEEQTREWVVIVDEAHNLIDRACDYYSAVLDFDGADAWIERLQAMRNPDPASALIDWLESMQADLERAWNQAQPLSDTKENNRREADFSQIAWELYQQRLQEITAQYYLDRLETGAISQDDPLDRFQWELNRFCLLMEDPSLDQDPAPTAQWIHATPSAGFRAELFCLDPGPRLAPIWNELGGAIVMSATLSPMDFFRERLGLPISSFRERFPAPFREEQRPVWIVPSINTTYAARKKSSSELAALIEAAARTAAPANLAVFFPSFAYLDMVRSELPSAPERTILVQGPSMGKEEREQILEALRSPQRGNLLLAVLGGIFAEGIDYRDTMLEGVIVVGPGLPAIGPERDALRKYYERIGLDGFTAAFAIPGMQRVLQAVGRLIRSESDYGFAMLICKRFTRRPYWELLPPEWRKLGAAQLAKADWRERLQGFADTHFR